MTFILGDYCQEIDTTNKKIIAEIGEPNYDYLVQPQAL
jgi:NADH dehydrogenase FAD-containing subunit